MALVPKPMTRARLLLAAALVVGLMLFGWAYLRPPLLPSVPLLTGDGGMGGGCYTFGVTGPLVADPKYGTAIRAEQPGDPDLGPPAPVMWPKGYTARQLDGEVAVMTFGVFVVAITGQRYRLDGGYLPDEPHAFLACGSVVRETRAPGPCPGDWCVPAKEQAWKFVEVEHPDVDRDNIGLTLSAEDSAPVTSGTTVRFEATVDAAGRRGWTFPIDCGVDNGYSFCTYVKPAPNP